MSTEKTTTKTRSFSDFIRNASVDEKNQVYMRVLKKAIKRQNKGFAK